MTPRKYKLFLAFFGYGGNGGVATLSPDVAKWHVHTTLAAKADKRIDDPILDTLIADTPITMSRNLAVHSAQQVCADILVMVDSDMNPDMYLGSDPLAKPFFKSSLDYLDAHYEQGPVCIGAPYCGPEPNKPVGDGESSVYIFNWANTHNGPTGENGLRLEMYPRQQAALMEGIAPVAALGTGLVMWDMRLFDYLPHPYFDYEWHLDGPPCQHCGTVKPGPRYKKASTEDCMHTRNMSLIGQEKLGYNPILCNWDAWAGHWKPKCIGKPVLQTVSAVNSHLRQCYRNGINYDDSLVYLDSSRIERVPENNSKPSTNGVICG